MQKNLTDTRRFHAHVDDLRNDVPLPSAIVKTRQQCVVVLIVQVSALARNSVSSGMPNHTLSTTQSFNMETVFQNTGWTTPPKTKPLHEAHISTNGNVDNFDFLFLAHAFRTPTTLFLSIGCTTVFNLSLATSLQHLGTRMCHARVFRNMFEETYSHCLCLILAVESANMQCPCNV